MEPEGSLPYSQVPATCSYPEPTPSSPPTPSSLLKIRLNIILPLRPGLPNGLFPSGVPTNTLCTPLYFPIRATCPAHLILLNFTTRTILGKEYIYTYIYIYTDKNETKRVWKNVILE
jgi:hypothetical protein